MSDFEALMKAYLPTSFGKQPKKKEKTEELKTTSIEPIIEYSQTGDKEKEKEQERKNGSESEGSERDEEEEEEEEEEDGKGVEGGGDELPLTHEIKLKDHTKVLSAITLDPSGSRLVSGGYDYMIKFWDFNGMDSTLRPFRSLEPCGNYQIRQLQFNLTGELLLIAPSSCQAKVLNRDGHEQFECVKGDMYIRDQHHTKGHVASLTSCQWHPTNKQLYMTAGEDSTIRVWDVDNPRNHKDVIVFKVNKPGFRNSITSCNFSVDGNNLIAGGSNGSIRVWNTKGPYHRPQYEVQAHMSGGDITSVRLHDDGYQVISRSYDDTLKLWDLRNFSKPLHVVTDLPNACAQTDCIWSPDKKYILTGTSTPKGQGEGKLLLFNSNTLEKTHELPISTSHVSRILWHPKINQIIAGSGEGNISVLYSLKTSVKGAKLCAGRQVSRTRLRNEAAFTKSLAILTPNALPMFQDKDKHKSLKRKREKIRSDPIKSHKPEHVVSGPGAGGRVSNSHFTHHIMKSLSKDTTRDEDPREALLKYAKVSEENPLYLKAYQKTQPKPVFDEEEYEEEEAQRRS